MDNAHTEQMHKEMYKKMIENFEIRPKLPICAYIKCRASDNKCFGRVPCMFFRNPAKCMYDIDQMTDKQVYNLAKQEVK